LRLPFSGLGIEAGDPSPATLFLGTEDDSLTLTTAPRPRLRVVVDGLNPGSLKLLWPVAATGYALEASDSLSALAWTAAPEQPLIEGTDYAVTIEANRGPRFFRLVKL
jgi:hypothetical protein